MADLRLNINGQNNAGPALNDAAGGVRNLTSAIDAGVTSALNWQKVQSAAIQFARDSVRAYEEQARADRQLARVAGESTEAFKRQASALQESLGVSDDMVETMQKMLLTYGQAPAEVDKTVRALLDYAAFTGKDAVAATEMLTSSTTTGRAAFKELGLQVDQSGDKFDRLRATTDALTKRLGGTAAADADSLSGSLAKMHQQFGELQESVGGVFAQFEKKTHVLEGATAVFSGLAKAIGDNDTLMKQLAKTALAFPVLGGGAFAFMAADTARVGNALKSPSPVAAPSGRGRNDLEVPEIDLGDLNKPAKADHFAEDLKDAARYHNAAIEDAKRRYAAEEKEAEEFEKAVAGIMTRGREDQAKINKKFDEAAIAERKELAALQEKEAKANADVMKSSLDSVAKANRDQAEQVQAESDRWAQAGTTVGAAFINAMSNAMNDAANGATGEEIAGEALAGIVEIAGTVIGSVYGQPQLGSALGHLAGTGIRLGFKQMGRNKKRHSGGWAGDEMPHYHSGAWVGGDEEAAILQSGERVLSRGEVASMGGPRGVEQAARGGAGMTINVQAFDGESTAAFMERGGARGLWNAARTGRSSLTALLGGA